MPKSDTKSKKASTSSKAKTGTGAAGVKVPFTNPDRLTPEPEKLPEVPKSTKEKMPFLHVGTWVRLGQGDNIPVEVRGHDAQITEAPFKRSDGDAQIPRAHVFQEEDTVFTVQTRDEFSATLQCQRGDFDVVSTSGGRTGLGHAG